MVGSVLQYNESVTVSILTTPNNKTSVFLEICKVRTDVNFFHSLQIWLDRSIGYFVWFRYIFRFDI